ncbi:MAG TPA: ComF family protein [Xanthomonadaceae bacterium]|nr:ComF family protein [Xanthomonadaceae bacterium]
MTLAADSLLQRLGRVLLPPRCLVCADPGAGRRDLCAACLEAWPWLGPACARCALPMPEPVAACGACLRRSPAFAATSAAFVYAEPVAGLLHRFKFGHDLAAGRLLADLAAPRLAGADPPDALLAVPLHRTRLAERGYNQAWELARAFARALGIPLLPAGTLQRTRCTTAQTELGLAARRRNVHGAFVLAQGAVLPRHLALVDDTMTTGATVSECARVLRRAGVGRVQAWVLARVPPPAQRADRAPLPGGEGSR